MTALTRLQKLNKFRTIATKALVQFGLTDARISFIKYTANAVYKISSDEGRFLLRIHGDGFQTYEAILEELAFLRLLNQNSHISAQNPMTAQNGRDIVQIDGKMVSLLTWVDGQQKGDAISLKHFAQLGDLMAKLHNFASQYRAQISTQHRQFWTADKMLGENCTFGSFDGLKTIKGFDQALFDHHRIHTLASIQTYQQAEPDKMGMIHTDLHFGNVIWQKSTPIPIDFDDGGFGSFVYDLCVPIYYMDDDELPHCRDAFLNAYCQIRSLSQADLAMIDIFTRARTMMMLSWSDQASKNNPKLKAHFEKRVIKAMNILKNV